MGDASSHGLSLVTAENTRGQAQFPADRKGEVPSTAPGMGEAIELLVYGGSKNSLAWRWTRSN